ncbi:TolC family protein [Hymenobacter sp. NBH84]|uniref:TolC family protein n=1 Tax=Hymenobacter sp. NBH84 TaxID=2596915 RepID=UPI00162427AF|nr:TolC family protein [Hymenobacter sp. NBH84]QNE38708.1 TolC family protein [Hymenobacter sp. NBH84]
MQIHLFISVLLISLLGILPSHAQSPALPGAAMASVATDTLALTLPQAEAAFLNTNFALLAERFNIPAAQADVVQARLFDNPEISLERNLFNPYNGRFFEGNEDRFQVVGGIEQVIQLGGKRRKAVDFARTGVAIAELEFTDLVRTLRYELRENFVTLFYRQQTQAMYARQIDALQQTLNITQRQYQRGNVALKEVVRLKTQLFELESELKDLRNDISEDQAELNLLLGSRQPRYLRPALPATAPNSLRLNTLPLAQALETARANRPDLQAAAATVQQQEQNVRLQKSLAVPDLNVGTFYDHNGAVGKHYTGLTVGMPLPLFNRNQGGIKLAQAQRQGSEQLLHQQEAAVVNEVTQAYRKAQEAERISDAFPSEYFTDADELLDGVLRSYQRKAIGLLEFLDFLDSYKSGVIQLNQSRAERLNAFDKLNEQLGQQVLNY